MSNQILGELLENIEKNILKNTNYGITSQTLSQLNELSAENKAIFWHDVGISYSLTGNDIKTIECMEKVLPDSENSFCSAQYFLGKNLLLQDKVDEAISRFLNISKNYLDVYINSRIDLGTAYIEKHNYHEAIQSYNEVVKYSNKSNEEYSKAIFSLGGIYLHLNEYTRSFECFKKVSNKFPDLFSEAKFGLALVCSKRKNYIEAIKYYESISEEYVNTFAKSNFNLGNLYTKKYINLEKAIESYQKISKDIKDLYAMAQWNLMFIFRGLRKYEKAIGVLENIDKESELYQRAKYPLYILNKIKIFECSNHLNDLTDLVGKILQELIVNEKDEELIAHYTNPTVTYLMLDHKKNSEDKVSHLRLNPIDFMNDPTEGKLIYPLIEVNFEIECAGKYKPFIGCFTLHYDSLNQFRLYGKEQQKEASGVSLVLNRSKMFSTISDFTFVNHIENEKSSKSINNIDENRILELSPTQFKLSLYRCIYFDPESRLIHLAQREEWTFCRQERKSEDTQWDIYRKKIEDITKNVRTMIRETKSLSKALLDEMYLFDKEEDEKRQLYEIIDEILLPLCYLIKHYAFKEEQECRAIYIAHWQDERIKLDQNLKRIYVDYQNILPAMKKIYLPVGALHHESALQYIGQTSPYFKFEVKRSHNPFRLN